MEIKPEDYVKKLKEISAKYSDADLITDVNSKKGYAFDPERRVRCLCFYCLEDIDREACGECFGKGILFVALNSGWGYRQSNLLKPSANPINEMTSSEYLEYHELLLSLYPESLDKSKWEPCSNHNETRCNCVVSRQVRSGIFLKTMKLSPAHLDKIEAGRAIRNRAKMVETAVKRPSISPSGMSPLEFLEYYEQKIKEHPDKAGGAWSLCLDHGYENCACSGSEEGEDSGFVHMGTAESPVVISQNKRLAEGRALRESNRISEELIKHAKDQTKVPYKIAYPTSEIRMNLPSPKPTTATADRVNKIAMAIDSIADDTLEASMRAAASQFVKLTREPLVAALTSGLGMEDNATSRAKVAKFLKSPLGDALVSGMLSAGVASLPVRADLKSGIAKELRVRAMGTAMDEAADLFMEPFRMVTAQLISGQASIGLLDSGERETLNLEAKVEERVEA